MSKLTEVFGSPSQ